jgi:hypothetical protein
VVDDLGPHVLGDRVARFSPGHHQQVSLSPLSAIADMVTPVVLITMAVIFANGLISTINTVGTRMFDLNKEQMDILTGPQGGRSLPRTACRPCAACG